MMYSDQYVAIVMHLGKKKLLVVFSRSLPHFIFLHCIYHYLTLIFNYVCIYVCMWLFSLPPIQI